TKALTHSDDYYATIVRDVYVKFLGRDADANGLNFWVTKMRGGLTDEGIQAAFIGSPEYYAFTGGTDRLWVEGMYKDLLGRLPDKAGEDFWVARLASGAGRDQVAYGFAASDEHEAQLIQSDYVHLLGRPGDANGVAFWVGCFRAGEVNEDLVA